MYILEKNTLYEIIDISIFIYATYLTVMCTLLSAITTCRYINYNFKFIILYRCHGKNH